jgi:hypothetical protein
MKKLNERKLSRLLKKPQGYAGLLRDPQGGSRHKKMIA